MKTPKYKYKTKGDITPFDVSSYHCLVDGVVPEKGIELVHSKEVGMESAARRAYRKNEPDYSDEVSHNRTSARINPNTGRTLAKGIQLYRLWFNYLKLALELEEMNVSLVVKNEFLDRANRNVPKSVMDKNAKQFEEKKLQGKLKKSEHTGGEYEATWRLKVIEKVKVKKSEYKGWDLDRVLTESFNEWWFGHEGWGFVWKTVNGKRQRDFSPFPSPDQNDEKRRGHSHLFEGYTPTFIDPKDGFQENDNFLYIRIDKTSQRRDVQAFFNDEVSKQLKGKTKNLFKVVGKSPRVNVIQNNYNALVLSLKGWTPKEIHYHDKIYNRKTDTLHSDRGDGLRAEYSSDKSLVTNISKSKRIGVFRLMEVCEGRFGNSPDTNW
ncbi:hypothetical protein N9I04_00115 [Alphaproteobacteria bacterium]|nr:hypothetical protein [Alphaproteobacteria bacterium]